MHVRHPGSGRAATLPPLGCRTAGLPSYGPGRARAELQQVPQRNFARAVQVVDIGPISLNMSETTKGFGSGAADKYLTPAEVAALLQVPMKTLAAWRSQRKGPFFHRYGVHVRYPVSQLEIWLAERDDDGKNWMAS
jgi:hypothetical protein